MKTWRVRTILAVMFLTLAAWARPARAADCAPVAVNALDQGWYDASGLHDPGNLNYLCGEAPSSASPVRNWFAFSIPASTQQVVAASLRIFTAAIVTPDASETFELRHVSTPVGALRLGGFGLTNVWADLGDGVSYGSRSFINAEVNLFVTVPLNAAFLANVQAAAGGTLALGGSLTTLDGVIGNSEYLFGGSSGGASNVPTVQLLLTYASAGPPVISPQPVGGGVNYGQNFTLPAQVCGAGPVAFQWFVQNTNAPSFFALSGATNSSLQLNNVTTNDTGLYRLVASNAFGSTTSALAQVSVNYAAPSGSTYRSGQGLNVPLGTSFSECANISAIPAAALQWQFNGTNLPGETNLCLDYYSVTTNQSGLYRVVATNLFGSFTTTPMTLVVYSAPPTGSIYRASGANPAPAGTTVNFCASLSGGPFSVQWQFFGTNIPGATSGCYAVGPVNSNHMGAYRVVASNASGVFTTPSITLLVSYQTPTAGNIYLQSGPSPVNAGSAVTLCASRTGAPSPSGQWQFNGVNLPGQTGDCLYLYNVTSNQAGLYRFFVSNSVGTAISPPFGLVVNYLAPTGSVYLSSGFSPAPAGSGVTLCASIQGAPFPSVRWQHAGTNIPGAECLSFSNLSSNEAGPYRLVLSNVAGVFTSTPLALVVSYLPPTVSISPSGPVGPTLAGNIQTFCATVTGAPAPGLQWYFNNAPLLQFGQCLQLNNVQTNQSGSYYAVATNVAGRATSQVAQLSVVYAAPTVSAYLSSGQAPVEAGSSFTLCSAVSGAPAPTRQWRFNGTDLPGEINSCLSITNAQAANAGEYSVVASNFIGLATSVVVRIAVTDPAVVRAYFSFRAPPFQIGNDVSLCGAVALPLPYRVQWRFNGADLPGESNVCLYLYPLDPSREGDYSLVATDDFNSYTSAPVALTVYLAPPANAAPYVYVGSSSALVGEDLTLYASHSGSPSYIQWRFNGANLPGQTNQLLSFFGLTASQAGFYSFTATNLAGATTSSVRVIEVGEQLPEWRGLPASQQVVAGSTVRFPAYARGGPVPEHYLQLNGTNVALPYTFAGCCGIATGGFTLLDVSPADAGEYTFIASNYLGSITSAPVTLTVTPAGPLDRWTQRHPLPQSQPLYDVTRGPSQWVAVGERGTIVTSADGSNWSLQNRRVDLPLYGVAHGAGVFVAVGTGGTILSSADGTNWAYRFASPSTFLNDIVFANGRFLALGSAPGIASLALISTDGINWGRVGLGALSANRCVTYGNGLFVSGGFNILRASADGTNWSTVFTPTREVESVTYANGLFVAVGDDGTIHVSANGTAWQSRASVTARRLLGVAYGAGKFVAVGSRGTILTSTDTLTWTPQSGGTFDRLEGIHFADGRFVAVGENGSIITSMNGIAWQQENLGTTRDLDGMAVANGRIVIVGKGGSILTTTDGVNYTLQNATVTNDLHGVAFGGGFWVAVGEPGIILTSPDAVAWTLRASGSTNSLKGVTHTPGRWVAVGTQGSVITSTNGTDWTAQTIFTQYDLNDVAFGNGRFLIAGDGFNNQNGSLYSSTNGVNWMIMSFYPGKNLRGLTFADGKFVMAANDGSVFRSDGINTFYNISYAGYLNLRAATWVNGLWIVVGNGGGIFTSTDLLTWTPRASRTFENFHRVAFLDGKLVAIGNRGTVLQSGRFITELAPPRWQPGVGFTFGLKGVIGQPYVVESSTDLQNWIPLLNFTNQIEAMTFTDTNAPQTPLRFYRVTEP